LPYSPQWLQDCVFSALLTLKQLPEMREMRNCAQRERVKELLFCMGGKPDVEFCMKLSMTAFGCVPEAKGRP